MVGSSTSRPLWRGTPTTRFYGIGLLFSWILSFQPLVASQGAFRWLWLFASLYLLVTALVILAGRLLGAWLFGGLALILLGFTGWGIASVGFDKTSAITLAGALMALPGFHVLRKELKESRGH